MISVLIPVFNEEAILESSALKVQAQLEKRGEPYELIVVSNGSTDQTVTLGQRLASTHPWFRFFDLPERGVGRAFVRAVREARGDNLVSLDIDLPTDLTFIDYAADLLKYGDIVIGSKVMGDQRRTLVRVLGSQLYILIAQLGFRLTISDYAPSTKAYRRAVVMKVIDHLDPWTGYVFELCLYCKLHGNRIVQIGVDCEDNRKSRFNLFHEGWYRYLHLFRCLRMLRDRRSWFHQA